MSVKTIFKTLFGTVMLIVFSSAVIELFNISINGTQLRQVCETAGYQSCVLFTQETYRENNGGGSVAVANVKDADGNDYIDGDFYDGMTDEKDIWESIYTSSDFEAFYDGGSGYIETRSLGGSTLKETYEDLDILSIAVKGPTSPGGFGTFLSNESNKPTWDTPDDSDIVRDWNKYTKARQYYNNMVTTVNLGIPYLDRTITNKMFQWELAKLLSNGNDNNIREDESGEMFVYYNGFRCYVQDAELADFEYLTYDITNSTDVSELEHLINVDMSDSKLKEDRADNKYVTVVSIQCNIPVSYEGVTPIRNIVRWLWDYEVGGYDGEGKTGSSAGDGEWNTDTQDLHTGEAGRAGGLLDRQSTIYYSLIR